MESLFFNTPAKSCKKTEIFKTTDEHLTRVDISNAIVFYDATLKNSSKTIKLKNLDRMVMLCVVKQGVVTLKDHSLKENSVTIFCTSRQDYSFELCGDCEFFVLFISDFFLKRYLNFSKFEPIDFLYEKIQGEVLLQKINIQPLDALTLYIIDKIINFKDDATLQSIRLEHRVMELIIHRFSLFDMVDDAICAEDVDIASRAKNILLNSFIEPPTIEELSHLCATNESKLKKVFKKVYKSTIYSYIQKLRLEEANLLLREEMLTIGDIAKRVGYKHQGHFSKLFFKVYGVYPKDLLKR